MPHMLTLGQDLPDTILGRPRLLIEDNNVVGSRHNQAYLQHSARYVYGHRDLITAEHTMKRIKI